MPTKLLVGIGNPGEDYRLHRHSIGFRAVDSAAENLGVIFKHDKKKAIFGKKKIAGTEVIILKPQTFVNLSGEAVLYIASFLKIDIENVLIIFDDINKKFGEIGSSQNSSEIEHSAVEHIEISLNNNSFTRVSFGIGPLPKNVSLDDFYLSEFSQKEEKKIPELLEKVNKLCIDFLDINSK